MKSKGRIVFPKAMRKRLPPKIKLVRRGRGLVAVPSRKLPPLTEEIVRETLERVRR